MAVNELKDVTIQETANGVMVRTPDGKLAKGTKPKNMITPENAREMQRKGVLAKRAVIAAEANRAVQDPELLDRYGDYAYVADLTRTQMQIATTPEAGKAAVLAANWVVQNTGMDEKAATEAGNVADAPVTVALVELLGAITKRLNDNVFDNNNYHHLDTVDADVAEEADGEGGEG